MPVQPDAESVVVVLHEDDDGQPPQGGHVRRFVEGTRIDRAVPGHAEGDPSLSPQSLPVAVTDGQEQGVPHDARGAEEPALRIADQHVAAPASALAAGPAHHLRDGGSQRQAQADVLGVRPVGGGGDVPHGERRRRADADGLLTEPGVHRTGDESFAGEPIQRGVQIPERVHALVEVEQTGMSGVSVDGRGGVGRRGRLHDDGTLGICDDVVIARGIPPWICVLVCLHTRWFPARRVSAGWGKDRWTAVIGSARCRPEATASSRASRSVPVGGHSVRSAGPAPTVPRPRGSPSRSPARWRGAARGGWTRAPSGPSWPRGRRAGHRRHRPGSWRARYAGRDVRRRPVPGTGRSAGPGRLARVAAALRLRRRAAGAVPSGAAVRLARTSRGVGHLTRPVEGQ